MKLPAPKMKRQSAKYFLVFVLLAAAVWYASKSLPQQRDNRPQLTLNEVIAPYIPVGWKVVREPDLPGPYRPSQESPVVVYRDTGGVQTLTYRGANGPVSIKLASKPDLDQMAIPLLTNDDRMTAVVLER